MYEIKSRTKISAITVKKIDKGMVLCVETSSTVNTYKIKIILSSVFTVHSKEWSSNAPL